MLRNLTFILITDSIPAENGGGISQTLYELFTSWPYQIIYISRPNEKRINGPILDVKIVTYKFDTFSNFKNRLFKILNPGIQIVNFNRQQNLKFIPKGLPGPQNKFVLVCTTEPIKLHFAWILQEKFGYTVVPYFMDDWMGGSRLKWKGGSIHEVVASLLSKASCRLMISRNLEETLIKRYSLGNKPCIVVHNPAPQVVEKTKEEVRQIKANTIIYAGSIWPMHFDALGAVARAVHLLQQQGFQQYKLKIFTSAAAWEHNKKSLQGPGVEYGGFIPYAELQEQLVKGWLLLVAAAFDERYASFTNSSVQTKLTDYMSAGKPVLYVGPEEGASGQFVHEWECGFTIGTNKAPDIAAQIQAIASMPELCRRKANNGLNAAKGYFRKEAVQERLYKFLDAHVK